MNIATEPVLGLEPQAEQERRLQKSANLGLTCCIASVVTMIAAVILDVMLAIQAGPHPQNELLVSFLILLFFLVVVFLLIGIGLGIRARRLRTGKIAIAVGLLPFGIYVLLYFVMVASLGIGGHP